MGNKEYVLKSLDSLGDVQYPRPSRSQYPTTYFLWIPVNIYVGYTALVSERFFTTSAAR